MLEALSVVTEVFLPAFFVAISRVLLALEFE
jgi:hypothetical protein